ncbi:MAG: hypothetical protein LAO31_13515 [Acidobacteriia bacterium]|nr:hypothetical protein [Terriglobia bacterium]
MIEGVSRGSGTDIRHLIHPQISRMTQNKNQFKVLGSTRHGGQEFKIVGP